ncbi:MAG: phosphoglucosamine mutase [Desulfobacterium sp.]
MGKLFGTDGIRGVANHYPMTVDVAMNTGRAVARFVRQHKGNSAIIGRDTRRSGTMLESALAAGLAAEGIDVYLAGVIPTPGVAFLASHTPGAGAGIVISASHNPYQDNGIKLFRADGYKLSEEDEATVESHLLELISQSNHDDGPAPITSSGKSSAPVSSPLEPGLIENLPQAREQYAAFLKGCFTPNNTNKPSLTPIVVDCSNGAASGVAEAVFSDLGFDALFIHNTPDGQNINEACGSQHTGDLTDAVLVNKARAGLAFDGDADRLIALDENGVPVTGDKILAICACHAASRGELPRNCVVSTVMSNIGLGLALADHDIDHEITGVGDRQVMALMQKTGAIMGGEDSGHMIFSQYHTTGDGILTALRLLAVMAETGESLSDLASVMTVYPQVLKNVAVSDDRPDFMAIGPIARAIAEAEKELSGQGRVLVRYSGTQPLLRVMVEGRDTNQIQKICDNICAVVRACIGELI